MVAVQDSSLRAWSKQTGNDCFAGSESVPGTEDEGQAFAAESYWLTRSIKVRSEFSHVGAVDQAEIRPCCPQEQGGAGNEQRAARPRRGQRRLFRMIGAIGISLPTHFPNSSGNDANDMRGGAATFPVRMCWKRLAPASDSATKAKRAFQEITHPPRDSRIPGYARIALDPSGSRLKV